MASRGKEDWDASSLSSGCVPAKRSVQERKREGIAGKLAVSDILTFDHFIA